MEEALPIVIDNGSGVCKCGFAGNDAPNAVFETLIGRPKYPCFMAGMGQRNLYYGEEADIKRGVLRLSHPMKNGMGDNWEDMEQLYDHLFHQELRVAPEEHPVLISEVPMNPKKNREKISELMFETFYSPFLHFSLTSLLSLYSSGRATGCVVESGDTVTSTTCFCNGAIIPHATRRVNIGGRDCTDYLMQLLNRKGHSFFTRTDYQQIKTLRQSRAFYDATNNYNTAPYTLPDGNVIDLSDGEVHECREILFCPLLIGREEPGICDMIHQSVHSCAVDIRQSMYGSVILAGGNTLFSDVETRVFDQLQPLLPACVRTKSHLFAPTLTAERQYSVWIGGSIQASLSSFRNEWVSREEYEEYGPNIMFRKCYYC